MIVYGYVIKARANLFGANLSGAYLSGADLSGADLSDLIGAIDLGTPYSWRVVMVGDKIYAGCRSFTIAEAFLHWSKRDDRKRMIPLLTYAAVVLE